MSWKIEHNGKAFQLGEGQVAFVGRHRDSQIKLDTKRTSEHHGVFFVQDGLLHYIDHGKPVAEKNYYGSSNGTFRAQDNKEFARIKPMEELDVNHGDQFRMVDEINSNESNLTLQNQVMKVSRLRNRDEGIPALSVLTAEQKTRFEHVVTGVLEKKKIE